MQAKPRNFAKGAFALTMAACLALGVPARAEVAIETAVLGDYTIALHLHPFLAAQELEILRLIASDQQYLSLFIPQEKGFSALAVSPDEGFVKDGAPVASAVALGGLADAATAAQNARDACQKAASSKTTCVVILDVAPK